MKKSVTRLALSLILISLLIPFLSFAPIPKVKAAEQNFFEDNFENYTVGEFPSSGDWELWYSGMGTEEQVIVDNVSFSPNKSLKLLGLDFWAGFAAKRFTSTSSVIGFEVAVRVEETKGQSRDNARVAFTTKLNGFISCEYAPVTFQDSGVIASGGQVLQSYVADAWYKIKLVMDRADDTYSVWVDGELKGENLTVTTTSGPITDYPSSEIEAFSVSQCYNSVAAYFDDVKVFSSYESNPTLELVPNTGIATTTLVGSGFAPDSQISVTWDGILIPTVPSQVITDGSGGFTCIVSVLNQTDGAYTISAVDETGNRAAATFTVTLATQSEAAITVPDDYLTIQEAINNAQEGDTIIVKAGTYYENVMVNKTLNLNGIGYPVIDGNESRSTVMITANGVTLQGFNATNCGISPEPLGGGIELSGARNCVIVGNNIYDNKGNGISLTNSNYNKIEDNTCENNEDGIRLWSKSPLTSSHNLIKNNICFKNLRYGIESWSYIYMTTTTNDNTITMNDCYANRDGGIYIGKSLNCIVSENTLSDNGYGIFLDGRAMTTKNISVTNNRVLNNEQGFYLWGTGLKETRIVQNVIENNDLGIYSQSVYDNQFYHNDFIQNGKQIRIDVASGNIWDDGYPSGGNYWSDYSGTDADEDGIGDVPYVIDENSQDNYPLMMPYSTDQSITYTLTVDSVPNGVAFTADQTSCMAPWSGTYNENTAVSLTMPESYFYEGRNYVWSRWNDGNTDRTRTVTMNGNRALTAVFEEEDTALKISVLSPQNRVYDTTFVQLLFTVNKFFYSATYSLDGQAEVAIGGNTTLTGLSEGTHSIVIYIEESPGSISASETIYFTVVPASFGVWILSPENKTYKTTDIALAYTINETCIYVAYGLDDEQTVVNPENSATLTGLADGIHKLTFYANYTDRLIGNSSTVWFTVDTTPPIITNVIHYSADVNGTLDTEVLVNATVTDAVTGVERVFLNYIDSNGTWTTVEMTKQEADIWTGTIPAFPHGTTITYTITAEDKMGNTVTTEEQNGQPNQYEVLPELPLWVIVPLFLTATVAVRFATKWLSSPSFAKILNSLHRLLT